MFGFFKKMRTLPYVYKLIDSKVNSHYTIKITGLNCDPNSDASAKNTLVKMITNGEIDKKNTKLVCATYMAVRESIIEGNGGSARWVSK